MKDVRIIQGDWDRCVSSKTKMSGIRFDKIGVFLDPPYSDGDNTTYGEKHTDKPAVESAKWAIDHGDDPQMRIIYSGYEGTVEFPDDWDKIEWGSHGGYANQGYGAGRANKSRERLWLSPHCLGERQKGLFG